MWQGRRSIAAGWAQQETFKDKGSQQVYTMLECLASGSICRNCHDDADIVLNIM